MEPVEEGEQEEDIDVEVESVEDVHDHDYVPSDEEGAVEESEGELDELEADVDAEEGEVSELDPGTMSAPEADTGTSFEAVTSSRADSPTFTTPKPTPVKGASAEKEDVIVTSKGNVIQKITFDAPAPPASTTKSTPATVKAVTGTGPSTSLKRGKPTSRGTEPSPALRGRSGRSSVDMMVEGIARGALRGTGLRGKVRRGTRGGRGG